MLDMWSCATGETHEGAKKRTVAHARHPRGDNALIRVCVLTEAIGISNRMIGAIASRLTKKENEEAHGIQTGAATETMAGITLAVEINVRTNEEKAIDSATAIKTKTGMACATREGGQRTGAEALIALADLGEGCSNLLSPRFVIIFYVAAGSSRSTAPSGLGAGAAVGAVVVVVGAVGDAGESRSARRHVASGSVPTLLAGSRTSITG